MKQTSDDGAGVFDAFGARPERWPPEQRAAAEQRLRDDPAARKAWAEATKLDAVLDAYVIDGDSARLAAIGEAILAEAACDEAEGWPFGPIGWPQGLGVASVVGMLTMALLAFAPAASGYGSDGLLTVLAPTLWLGTY